MFPRIRFWLATLFALGLLLGTWATRAEVRLHGLFTDHMVLQQGHPIPVWGWADEGERVWVLFEGERYEATVQLGQWRVELPKQKPGGPYTLVAQSLKNRVIVRDIVVGEVWICSGQSNMNWPLGQTEGAEAAIASAENPNLRLYTVPRLKADAPVVQVAGQWALSSPEAAKNFSAVAYYFGRDVQAALHLPIGLIHTSWGGSPAEAWLRERVLAANAGYRQDILEPYPDNLSRFQEDLEKWEREKRALEERGEKQTRRQPRKPWRPSELYNGMIAPLIPFPIRGVIWYQGEANASRAFQYRTLFPNMIQNWRDDWGLGYFPFLAVQLAPWDKNRQRSPEQIMAILGDSDWAELREAQLMAARAMQNVRIIVTTDVGEKDDIHPRKKQPVGERLALAAMDLAYEKRVVSSGPVYERMKIKKDKVYLYFDSIGGGLESRGGELRGFAVAAEDGRFFRAKAEIDGKRVIVSHPLITKPAAVRYGWADYPIVNLFNAEGLPASPFRTDDWPMITAPRE